MGEHRRFFVSPEQISGDNAVLTGDTARQISKVLRLREGDCICLLDGSGIEHNARISAVSRDEVEARIFETGSCANEARLRLTLAICHPKGDKLELIVQKATELGISRVVIVNSERTVARPEDSKIAERLVRWRRIAAEAAEQSCRSCIPEIDGVVGFEELIDSVSGYQLALVAWEDENETSLRDVIRGKPDVESVLLIIGPEGGLTNKEVEDAKAAGARCVTFGKRVLRSETAAIAGCAAIMYELEGEL